jgi:nitroreductase
MNEDIFDVIRQRRSVRLYQPDPVPREEIEALLEAARWAPSNVNTQPWRIQIVADRRTLDELNQATKRFVIRLRPLFPLLRRLVKDLKAPEMRRVFKVVAEPSIHVLYRAPVLVLVCTEGKPGHDEMVACCLATENMLLAAHSLGLGTCVLGVSSAWNFIPRARRLLGLARRRRIIIGFVLGYPQKVPAAPSRHPAGSFTTWR